MNELVSVCIPTYNGAQYLKEALDSVQAQSYANVEVVISDDKSTDATFAVAQAHELWAQGRVRWVTNEVRGIGNNWNNAIFHAKGAWVKLLFQDDLLLEGCIEQMLLAAVEAEKNGNVAVVICNKRLIGDVPEGRQEQSDLWFDAMKGRQKEFFFGRKDFYKHPRNPFGEPVCTMMRKRVWEQEPYDSALRQGLDYEHTYRLLDLGQIVWVDAKLAAFRLHAEQTTERNKKRVIEDVYLLPARLLARHGGRLPYGVRAQLWQKRITGWLLVVWQRMRE